jgi:hypothetical protein
VRGIAVRLIEEYAAMLNKRGLPITPGLLNEGREFAVNSLDQLSFMKKIGRFRWEK